MSAANELLIKLKTIAELGGFDSLEGKVKKAATDMKGMENTTNAAAKKMKTDLEQVNNTNFSSLNNKFTSTIRSMVSTSASGAKAIGQNLSSMTDGIDGAITSVAAGMGVMELFEKSMGKSLTSTQLHNAKPGDYQSIMDQYMKFTTASSASDDDINKMLRYTYSGNSSSTYKAINAVDAISYNADKLQRQEGIRGWGTYLSGGWSAASGMMRDEPLTADQVKLLQNAKTYDQRIAAMETIAKQKGNMDSSGNSLSTTTDGTLGKYNKTLAFADSIMRGATSTFETFMTTIDPIITGFNNLDPGIKDVIGGTLTWGILLTAGAAGLGILSKVLSPVGSVLSTGVGKLKDALSGAKDVKDKVSGLKDALDGKKLVSTVSIKAATVNVNGKTTGTGGTTGGTGGGKTTGTGGTSTGSRSGVLSTALSVIQSIGVGLGVGDLLGEYVIKPSMGWLTGQPVSKSYGGVLNVIDSIFGTNTATPVSQKDYDTTVREYNKGKANVSDYNKDWNSSLAWLGGATGNTFSAIGSFGSWISDPIKAITGVSGNTPLNIPSLPSLLGLNPASAANSTLPGATVPAGATTVTSTGTTGWQFPTLEDMENIAKEKILGTLGLPGDLTFEKVQDTVKTKIFNLLGLPGNLSWEQVKEEIRKKILNALGLPGSLSWSRLSGWVMSKVYGFLHLPGNISFDTIKGWVMSAVGLGGEAGGDNPDQGLGQGSYAEKNTSTNLSDYVMPVTSTSNSTTKKETNYNVTVKVDTVDSDSRVDQIGQAVAIVLNNHNNSNGN